MTRIENPLLYDLAAVYDQLTVQVASGRVRLDFTFAEFSKPYPDTLILGVLQCPYETDADNQITGRDEACDR